jgi:predicted nucleic acid-binding protein
VSQVIVDANVLVKLVLDEDDSDAAQDLWQIWNEQETERFAPPFFPYESVAAIRWNVVRKVISPIMADAAFRELTLILNEVHLLAPPELHERAWEIAKQLQQGQVYDAYYVALAEILDCEMWTADEKLYRAAFRLFPKVKHIRSARRK